MCVAAVLQNRPADEDIRLMFKDNPHGAGLAWYDGDPDGPYVQFVKGLMTADDVIRVFNEEPITYPALLHFRWATHGEKVPELTHPFVLGPRALFGELKGYADAMLIHNGTWSGYYEKSKKIPLPSALLSCQSDTSIAAYFAEDDESILDEVQWATAVARATEWGLSVTTRGTWYTYKGNSYSNLTWQTDRVRVDWSQYGDAWGRYDSWESEYNEMHKWTAKEWDEYFAKQDAEKEARRQAESYSPRSDMAGGYGAYSEQKEPAEESGPRKVWVDKDGYLSSPGKGTLMTLDEDFGALVSDDPNVVNDALERMGAGLDARIVDAWPSEKVAA